MRSPASNLASCPERSGEQASIDVDALEARVIRVEKLAEDQAVLVGLFAELLSNTAYEQALDALAGALKQLFDCERVAIAIVVEGRLTLRTVSQQGVLEASTAEAYLLVDAMSEACDQEKIVCWPSASNGTQDMLAHRALAGRRLSSAYCSTPLFFKEELVGAFLLERRDQQEFPVVLLEQLSMSLAPLIVLHQKADRKWYAALRDTVRSWLSHYLGQRHPGRRLCAIVAAIAVLAALMVPTRWEIVAAAELVSTDRRVLSAPHDTFISDVVVDVGQRVTQGQVLVEFDTRQIKLEIASRDSDIAMANAEFRAAMSSRDGQSTGIARARLAQARARREAVAQRMERSALTSPIDGLVISSDTTHAAGTAVSRGETMFEVAPDTGFDVHVLVDEADIYDVAVGQSGSLSLRALPGQQVPITVTSIRPVAEAVAGENRFRVSAAFGTPDSRLRPGQSGVARLQAGQTNLLGRLTRRLNRRVAEIWWRWLG